MTAGVVAFAVFAVGFFAVCAAIIWWRAHSDATRVAAYFEDDSMPVRTVFIPLRALYAAPEQMSSSEVQRYVYRLEAMQVEA